MVQRPIDGARPYEALTALRQGSLDGLCGLYASINAIQLAIYPERRLSRRHLRQLFKTGVGVLSKRRWLRAALTDGIEPDRIWAILDILLSEATALAGVEVTSVSLIDEDTRDIRVALARIKEGLRDNEPVILSLEGRHDHWTVAVASTSNRLILFDSDGLRWLDLRSLTLSERSARPHLLSADGVMLISRLHPRRLASLSKFISVEEVVNELEPDEPSGQRCWRF